MQSYIFLSHTSIQLAVAMFASYVCRVAAAKSENETKYDQDCPEFYASLQLCFQVGDSVTILFWRSLHHLSPISQKTKIVIIIMNLN